MTASIETLSEKEKQVLRLLARGHSAKSCAQVLSLSVHAVHDRLRGARQKLKVTSSREAARLMLDQDPSGDWAGGDEVPTRQDRAVLTAGWRAGLTAGLVVGASVALPILFLHLDRLPASPSIAASNPRSSPASNTVNAAALIAAERWLEMIDAAAWEVSFNATGKQFRNANSVEVWAKASQKAREPLGAIRSRTLVEQQWFNAPPNGYLQLRYRSDFQNRAYVLETVTLEKEDDGWRAVGIMLD